MADVASNLFSWSTTASSNSPNDNTTIGAGLADNFQEIQKVVRQDLASKGADIASATTTDLGAVAGHQHDITGVVTITGFGTVAAGIWKIIKFEGVLTLTHNATSLILPGGANITTADGDVAVMVSEGSGNWRCAAYQSKATPPKPYLSTGQTIGNATLLTLAHGLGAEPTDVTLIAQCTDAGGDEGYAQGDRVVIVPLAIADNGATNRGVTIYLDATNVYVRFGATANPLISGNKTTGVPCVFTSTKWQLYVKARI